MFTNVFANLYEWWGLEPFYSTDLADHLKGYDITCTGYFGTPWYLYIGIGMVISIVAAFFAQYYFIDSPRYMRRHHLWITTGIVVLLNFFAAFGSSYTTLQSGDYCKQLHISTSDCLGFGLSDAFWTLFWFVFITSVPLFRRGSTNCRHTNFLKP